MVSKLCQEWFDKSTAVVIRFLGISPDSSLLRRLLLSLCQQIAALLDLEYDMSQRKVSLKLENIVFVVTDSRMRCPDIRNNIPH